MKAIVRRAYGPPDVLRLEEVPKPTPKDNEVLVRVHAATVNRTDCGILWGKPFILRFGTGLFGPGIKTTGTDFAGVVEAVGAQVHSFKEGDRVWGFNDMGLRSHAEYMVVPGARRIATIPDNFTFGQAAASAEGAHYAYNFINKVKMSAGQKVLVNGATGAIGCAATQLLKARDVYVTAVCAGPHTDLLKSFGADRVIDFMSTDFTKDHEQYDFVFDAVGKSTFGKCKRLLKKTGVYISSELGPGSQNPFLALITPLLGRKKVKFPFPFNIDRSLHVIKDLMERGQFKPAIDRTYSLEQVPEAFRYVASGQKVGNVVVKVAG